MVKNIRSEHDLLGQRDLPSSVYYGINTLRAVENFPITNIPLHHFPNLIRALAYVKKAAVRANADVGGVMRSEIGQAIEAACDEIISGKYHDQFIVDMVQGGAGTSTNMNANEVICNIALEKIGYNRGEYQHIHPNNHVNLSQSTNDVYPTAVHLAILLDYGDLTKSLRELCISFRQRGEEFSSILKVARTQLQDAVPMTLGQEFKAFASTLESDISRIDELAKLFLEVNLGGTAIGTGVNTKHGYAERAIAHLRDITGLDFFFIA